MQQACVYAKVSGAVIASGLVIVEGKPKSVQHLDGGIVSEINVDTGDFVESGEVLVRLDDSSIQANLAIYEVRLREALIKQARLHSELNGGSKISPPMDLVEKFELGDISSVLDQQNAMKNARFSTLDAQLVGQDERVAQFKNQIEGLDGLIYEKLKQISGYDEELESTNILLKQELVSRSQLIAIERAKSDIMGQVAEHKAEISRVHNSIAETNITKLQINREFAEKVISETEQIQTRIEELSQQLLTTRKQFSRIHIKAPVSGVVHELGVYTIGGVVQPGQVLMQIIEQKDLFEIELNIDLVSIDQIFIGQPATIRFPAFHQRTTPELKAMIKSISPSSIVDEKTGVAFYRASVDISPSEFSKLGEKNLFLACRWKVL